MVNSSFKRLLSFDFSRTFLLSTGPFNTKITCRVLSSKNSAASKSQSFDLAEYPADKIRNFGIIAHVDHGKSTLADRLLEITGTINKSKENKQVLDKLQVERERGITVKAQTASMFYKYKGQDYLLNLIDTPGHVDFSYEVARSMTACQGVLLVVDASQGIQAQTLANFYLALDHEVEIIPVINKIDLKTADVARVKQEMNKVLGVEPDDVMCVSAKHGTGVNEVLDAVINRLPSPIQFDSESYNSNEDLKVLLFDSHFETHRGVVANVLVKNGKLKKGDKVTTHSLRQQSDKPRKPYEVKEVGILQPERCSMDTLYAGQVGYMMCGMKNTSEALIGDTIFDPLFPVTPLPGFKKSRPVVFGCMYPIDQSQYKSLEAALNRLTLNDNSVHIQPSVSVMLGAGFRVGFLGLLHMDVFQQRLQQEHDATVIMTSPTVLYKALLKDTKKNRKGSREVLIRVPSDLPERNEVEEFLQPMINATIIAPAQFEDEIQLICMDRQGTQLSNSLINEHRLMLQYRMPMSEVMVDFYDKLKSISSGYASFDYDEAGYESTEIVKLEFLLNGTVVEELTSISLAHKARQSSTRMCGRLKELLPRQPYPLTIQAAVGKNILARETLPAMKKDVLAKCSGGDFTRKLKLLRRHAKHQKALKEQGSINIPKNLFVDILK